MTAILEGLEENSLISFAYMPKFNAPAHAEAISKILGLRVACTLVTEDLGHSIRQTYLGRKRLAV